MTRIAASTRGRDAEEQVDAVTASACNEECRRLFEQLECDRSERRRFVKRFKRYSRDHLRSASINNHLQLKPQQQQYHIKTKSSETTAAPPKAKSTRKAHEELPKASDAYVCELIKLLKGHGLSRPTGGRYVHLDRALVHLYYASGQWVLVHHTVRQMVDSVPKWMEQEIELLWDHASYAIVLQQQRERRMNDSYQLNSVNMYRIRRRMVCPTLAKNGIKKYKVSPAAMSLLTREFEHNPRPRREIKEMIANQTGLSIETVSNWFKNKRQRLKKTISMQTATTIKQEHSEPTYKTTKHTNNSVNKRDTLMTMMMTMRKADARREHQQLQQQQQQKQVAAEAKLGSQGQEEVEEEEEDEEEEDEEEEDEDEEELDEAAELTELHPFNYHQQLQQQYIQHPPEYQQQIYQYQHHQHLEPLPPYAYLTQQSAECAIPTMAIEYQPLPPPAYLTPLSEFDGADPTLTQFNDLNLCNHHHGPMGSFSLML